MDPERVRAKQKVNLVLKPVSKEQPRVPVKLEPRETEKLHLTIVKDDLSWLAYVHPQELTDGTYRATQVFPARGDYTIFADYKPVGGEPVVERVGVKVRGRRAPKIEPSQLSQRLQGEAGDGFSAILSPRAGAPASGKERLIQARILKDGEPVDPLQLDDFMGNKAQLVIVGLENKSYQRLQPDIDGPDLNLRANFEAPGVYRVWLQFQSAGKRYATDFVLQVSKS